MVLAIGEICHHFQMKKVGENATKGHYRICDINTWPLVLKLFREVEESTASEFCSCWKFLSWDLSM